MLGEWAHLDELSLERYPLDTVYRSSLPPWVSRETSYLSKKSQNGETTAAKTSKIVPSIEDSKSGKTDNVKD